MKILITGGAGFLGANLARELSEEHDVVILDNFSRPGSEINAEWLDLPIITQDINDKLDFRGVDAVFHLAGQVTVTESVKNPLKDFKENALGTLNVLEEARKNGTIVIFSSTNKVYGKVEEKAINEECNLNFKSPYGCSKGCADQYVRDYYATFGLPTVVLRQSCIHGIRQFGMEGQGWISWFIKRIIDEEELTIYGDGNQVRDLLYVSDWVEACKLVLEKIDETKGEAYNLGGGVNNTTNLLNAIKSIEFFTNKKANLKFDKPRVSDQGYYVSDISKISKLGWSPEVSVNQGLKKTILWQESIS